MKVWTIYAPSWRLHGTRPSRYMPRATCTFDVCCGSFVWRLTSEWWVGIWPAAGRRRALGPLPVDTSWTVYRRPLVKKKVAAAAAGGDARHLAAIETELLAGVLPLVEHCAVVRYDDGDPRETGWFTVKTLGAAWIIQVKDPDTGNSFQFVSDRLDKALEGAALLLACEEAPWQPDAFLKKKKNK